MKRTRLLRTVVAGCAFALLAAAPASAMYRDPRMPPATVKGPSPIPIPYPNVAFANANQALVTMTVQLNDIVATKSDTDRSAVVALWNTTFQIQRDTWLAEMQAAIEAHKAHLKQKGKEDAATIASFNAQVAAQLSFLNANFGAGGAALAEWKLDFNQRKAGMAVMGITMPAVSQEVKTNLEQMEQGLKSMMEGMSRPEASPNGLERMAAMMMGHTTMADRIARAVNARQKVVDPFLKASAFPELKKRLEPILNALTPEQVAQDPNLASLPPEVVQTLQHWKTVFPKKCEDAYGPIWASARKAIEWLRDPARLFKSDSLFKNAKSFDDVGRVVGGLKSPLKEALEAVKARWKLVDVIKDAKKLALEQRRAVPPPPGPAGSKVNMVAWRHTGSTANVRVLGDFDPQKATERRREADLLVQEHAALLRRLADAYCSADGREYDELITKCSQAKDAAAAAALWADFTVKRTAKIVETVQFIAENNDEMLKLKEQYERPPGSRPTPSQPKVQVGL